jgi:hypothetical protein
MVDILHRIGIQTPTPGTAYEALTTVEGLAGWWTEDVTGVADELGGVLAFRFPPVGGFDMEVRELRPAARGRGTPPRGPTQCRPPEARYRPRWPPRTRYTCRSTAKIVIWPPNIDAAG